MLQTWDYPIDSITNWTVSNVTFTDDSPFEAVKLPFSFLFYDHKQDYVWISPNGFLSFAPGVPCDCCYNGLNCDVETQQYQGIVGAYLADLNPLHSNSSSIEYGWDDNYFVTRWIDVPIYGNTAMGLDFEIALSRNGSILFHYSEIFLPLPNSYSQGDSFVGIRPIYQYGNRTHRSPLLSTNNQIWNSALLGNYATYTQLYAIQDAISTASSQTALHFCLFPTTFCITPHTVSTAATPVTAHFSTLQCGDPTQLQFLCLFDLEPVPAELQPDLHTLTCTKPPTVVEDTIIDFKIAVASIGSANYTMIPTVHVMNLTVAASASASEVCNAEGLTCSPCGTCSNSTLCLGADGDLFGQDPLDCPAGKVMDRAGLCCAVDELDCRGYCGGPYAEALDTTTASYSVCCLNSTIDCFGVCGGSAVVDRCGVCSGGFTNHTANSDMDCVGVCFGNYTTHCDIHLTADSLSIPLQFDLEEDLTFVSTTVFVNNTTPFYGILLSYPLIHNVVPPSVYYTLSMVNETELGPVFTPLQPDSFVMPGYARIAITISASVQALLNSPQQYERSIQTMQLEFVFQSVRPTYQNQTEIFPFEVSFHTRGCHVVSNVRGCNLFPGCFGCPLNSQSHLYSNYFSKSYVASPREYIYKEIGTIHYFTCVEKSKQDRVSETCSSVVEYTRENEEVLLHSNFMSILGNYYMVIVYCMIGIMLVIVIMDFRNMLSMRQFEEELWQLYLNDYAEYRSIMTTFHEMQQEDEDESEERGASNETNETNEVDKSDGADEIDKSDGADEISKSDGADEIEKIDGADEIEKIDGADEIDKSDGADEIEKIDGADEIEKIDGADEVNEANEANEINEVNDTDKVNNTDSFPNSNQPEI